LKRFSFAFIFLSIFFPLTAGEFASPSHLFACDEWKFQFPEGNKMAEEKSLLNVCNRRASMQVFNLMFGNFKKSKLGLHIQSGRYIFCLTTPC